MDKLKKIADQMQKLDGKSIKIGVMDGEYPDGTSVVDVAIFNEYGTDNAPPRAFMRQAEENTKSRRENLQAHLINKLQLGQASVDDVVETTGEWYQKEVQAEITSGDFEANKASTIAQKGSSNPLIDTGLLRSSVKWDKS